MEGEGDLQLKAQSGGRTSWSEVPGLGLAEGFLGSRGSGGLVHTGCGYQTCLPHQGWG